MELELKILMGLVMASWILTLIALWLTYKRGYLEGKIDECKRNNERMERQIKDYMERIRGLN